MEHRQLLNPRLLLCQKEICEAGFSRSSSCTDTDFASPHPINNSLEERFMIDSDFKKWCIGKAIESDYYL